MIRTLIAAAVGAAALAGGQYYATGAVPFLDAPQPVAVAQAAPSTPQAVPTAAGDGSAVVPLCEPQRAQQGPAQAVKADGLVNLNTAAESELDALPEVGRSRVARIVAARPIRSIEDLAGPGMPASVIAMLKARATV
jgi:DNA uptake protein ComE-like DNA-binding protein